METAFLKKLAIVAAGVIGLIMGVVVLMSAAPTGNETVLGWGEVALGAGIIIAAVL